MRVCREEFGYDSAGDYRADDLESALDAACPKGVDVYFDNTGGPISDSVMRRLAVGARVVICGTASFASWDPPPQGPRVERVRGRYLVIEPPDRLVFSWGFAGSDDLPPEASTVEVNLVAEPDGTRVTLVHRLLPSARQRGHEVGWRRYLGHLGRVVLPNEHSETMSAARDACTRPGVLPQHPCT